jgi:hypothetical protein
VRARAYQRVFEDLLARVEATLTDALVAAYEDVIQRASTEAAESYRAVAASAGRTIAAAGRPDELINPARLREDMNKSTYQLRRHAVDIVVDGLLAAGGVSAAIRFDVAPLAVDALTEQIGLRARDLERSLLRVLQSTIDTAVTDGWTVPETASAIQTAVAGTSAATATMLARTDLIGLANGGSITAARHVLDEGATKTWLSGQDDRVRPTHQDADGQTVPIGGTFQVGDDQLDYPGDPSGSDEEVINCRCTVIYNDPAPVNAGATREDPMDEETTTVLLEAGNPEVRVPINVGGVTIGYATADLSGETSGTSTNGGTQVQVSALGELLVNGQPTRFATEAAEATTELGWVSDLAFEGAATSDDRWIEQGALSWRDLPLTMLAQTETAPGHDGAQVAGRIDTLTRDAERNMDGDPLPENVTALRGTGVFDTDREFGQDIEGMVDDEFLTGVSIDMAVHDWAFRDPDTGAIIPVDEMTEDDWDRAFFGELQFAVLDGEIMAATICATPAFSDARVATVASALVASGHGQDRTIRMTVTTQARVARQQTLTASAAGLVPEQPPADWFEEPGLTEPTPLTVTDDGRVFGHVAAWGTCHIGIPQRCQEPPEGTDYSLYETGLLRCSEGNDVRVGRLTMDTGHAPLHLDAPAAASHYDNTGTVVAYVTVGEDEHGIWMAGTLRPDLPASTVRALRAAGGVSGDWRPVNGRHEMVGVLVVNVPGFPIPRPQAVVVASADGGEEYGAIVAAGVVTRTHGGGAAGDGDPAIRIRVLAARAAGGMKALADIAG